MLHSFDPRIQAVAFVENELKEQSSPRRMILQVVVKLRGHRAQLRQIIPWDRGQIVVLIVVAHIQRDTVDRPVVTERLLIEIIRVMLLDPTSAYWMQANRKEKREREIKKPRPTAKINNRDIVPCRAHEIHKEPPVPHGDRFQSRRPGQLEKGK